MGYTTFNIGTGTEIGFTGDIDGVNATFVTEMPFNPGHLKVYLQGVRLIAQVDYSTVGQNTIIFTVSPLSGENITIDFN